MARVCVSSRPAHHPHSIVSAPFPAFPITPLILQIPPQMPRQIVYSLLTCRQRPRERPGCIWKTCAVASATAPSTTLPSALAWNEASSDSISSWKRTFLPTRPLSSVSSSWKRTFLPTRPMRFTTASLFFHKTVFIDNVMQTQRKRRMCWCSSVQPQSTAVWPALRRFPRPHTLCRGIGARHMAKVCSRRVTNSTPAATLPA